MTLKMTFLGAGCAFSIGDGNFHSNVLLQTEDDNLLLDAGSDLRFSLHDVQLSHKDINNVYISHLHNDHIGGLEWLALGKYFNSGPEDKPSLFASEKLIEDLWEHCLSGGLQTLQTRLASLDTYFKVHSLKKHENFTWQSIQFQLVQTIHIVSEYEIMPCFGLIFNYGGKRIFYTADTQFAPSQLADYYEEADIIFHDCETSATKSGVHAHYTELLTIPAHLKKKIWLYHYNSGKLPDAKADGFCGFVAKGQSFLF